jgi:hypothetical protein
MEQFVVALALVSSACNSLLLWRVVKLLDDCTRRRA